MIILKALVSAVYLVVALAAAPVSASLSQGYAVDADIATGSMVSLDESGAGKVVVSTPDNVSRLFGVVVPPSSASISLSGGSSKQVQVGTTGTVTLLVSNAGGDIHLGDYITISSIAGVGQRSALNPLVLSVPPRLTSMPTTKAPLSAKSKNQQGKGT